jgi:hypothetical protein
MLCDMLSIFWYRNMVESVFSEKVIPKNENWRLCLTVEIVIPFFQHWKQLIALLSDNIIREKYEFSLSVNEDEHLFSLLDQRICGNWWNQVPCFLCIEFLFTQSTNGHCDLLFCRTHCFLVDVTLLILGCQVSVCNYEKSFFGIWDPSLR